MCHQTNIKIAKRHIIDRQTLSDKNANGQNVIGQIEQQSDIIRLKYNSEITQNNRQVIRQNYNNEKPQNRWTPWDKNTITKHHEKRHAGVITKNT